MPTKPKSLGSKSRAKIISEPIRRRKLAPWEQILAKPPRIVRRFKSFIALSHYSCGYQPPYSVLDVSFANSEHQFAAVKSLGVTAGGIAFHTAQPHEG